MSSASTGSSRRNRRARALLLAGALALGGVLAPSLAGAATRTTRHPTTKSATARKATTRNATALPSPTEDEVSPVLPASTSLPRAVSWLESALSTRKRALTTLLRTVQAAPIPATAVQAIDSILSGESSGIDSLASSAQSATSLAAVQSDANAMVLNYRVVVLVEPQVRDLLAVGHQLTTATAFTTLESQLQVAILASEQAPAIETAAQRIYAQFVGTVSALTSTENATEAGLVALTPQSYPATSTFASVTTALGTGASDIAAAQADVHAIVALLERPVPGTQSGSERSSVLQLFARVRFRIG